MKACASSWSLRNASSTGVLAEGAKWKLYGKICVLRDSLVPAGSGSTSHAFGDIDAHADRTVAVIRTESTLVQTQAGDLQGNALTFKQLAMVHDVKSHALLSMQASISTSDAALEGGNARCMQLKEDFQPAY